MPPEVMGRNSEVDGQTAEIDGTKWDVFGFAVMTTYILSGVPPHKGLDNQAILTNVLVHDARTPIPPALDNASLVSLIGRMWTKQPDQRPPFAEITSELRRIFGDFDELATAHTSQTPKRHVNKGVCKQ